VLLAQNDVAGPGQVELAADGLLDRLVGLGHVRHVGFRRHLQVDRAEAIHREIVGVVGQDVRQPHVVMPGVGHAA
jgi:hypothetical protein